jgi:phytoene synthase
MSRTARSADLEACRVLLREGSKSFHVASLLLPRRVRDEASAVYAWCRVGDHAVDHEADPAAAVRRLDEGLERIYAGEPDGPVERSFAWTADAHGIPRSVPAALLEGFGWDAAGRTYETLDELIEYCVRVGSTVGIMMSLVMGRRSPTTLRAASRLGVAMQLTNIARDVGEDARMGRLYLPRELLVDRDIEPRAWLSRPEPTSGVRRVVQTVLDAADALYAASWRAIDDLPARCRPAIRAAAVVYAEIGARVRSAGCDSVTRRVWTGPADKVGLVTRAMAGRPGAWSRKGTAASAEDLEALGAMVRASGDRAAAFLVEAAAG